MMRLVRRGRRLSLAEWRLVLEATLALGAATFVIAFFPFRWIAAGAARKVSDKGWSEDERVLQVERVRWAVTACARRVPWRAKCFEQGLAAQWMLGRRGLPSRLHYGLAKGEAQTLVAHVWLRSGGLDVVGCQNMSDFVELASFPD